MKTYLPQDRTLHIVIVICLCTLCAYVRNMPKQGQAPKHLNFSSELAWKFDDKKLNLNTASAIDLMQLPRISRKVAEGIVSLRELKGGFKSMNEIDEVKGVGIKTLEKFRLNCEL